MVIGQCMKSWNCFMVFMRYSGANVLQFIKKSILYITLHVYFIKFCRWQTLTFIYRFWIYQGMFSLLYTITSMISFLVYLKCQLVSRINIGGNFSDMEQSTNVAILLTIFNFIILCASLENSFLTFYIQGVMKTSSFSITTCIHLCYTMVYWWMMTNMACMISVASLQFLWMCSRK